MSDEAPRAGAPDRVGVRPLKEIPDARGSFLKILMRQHLPAPGEFGEIYVTTGVRGATKGSHFHERSNEWFCLLRGRSRLWLRDLEPAPGPVYVLDLDASVPVGVHVPPRVAHAFENPDDELMVVLAYADKPYDPNDTDTVPFTFEGIA